MEFSKQLPDDGLCSTKSSNGNGQSLRTLLQDFERLVARLREALEVESGITAHVVRDVESKERTGFVIDCHVADKDAARKHVPFPSREAARLVLTFNL